MTTRGGYQADSRLAAALDAISMEAQSALVPQANPGAWSLTLWEILRLVTVARKITSRVDKATS